MVGFQQTANQLPVLPLLRTNFFNTMEFLQPDPIDEFLKQIVKRYLATNNKAIDVHAIQRVDMGEIRCERSNTVVG